MDAQGLLIHNFFDRAVEDEFARDYLFRVTEITFDGGAVGNNLPLRVGPNDLIYAKTAKLPARTIVNHNVRYSGQNFNLPGSVEYPGSDSYTIQFYCPESLSLRELFINESVRTFNSYDGVAGSSATGGSIASKNSLIKLKTFNKNYDQTYTYTLLGCSIREVGELEYNIAEGNGAILSFNVNIAYHMFKRTAENTNLRNAETLVVPNPIERY
jgi:hypothetical protein